FFYEVKSNLARDQIRLLAEAGVRRIQPGIESLSSRVLQSMRKGVSALQNVNTLRWSLYYGIRVDWNLLWGFPGETAADCERQEALMPLLAPLEPAAGGGRLWMERFSPLFTEREAFPVRYLRPEADYAYVYPSSVDLGELAYFFEYEFADSLPD